MPDIANVFGRHEFVVRRLHSLLGLMPVGAFLGIHLATNASILDGPTTFQQRVDQIHSIGSVTLFFVEWCFIFLPILFHGLVGLVIVARGKRNLRYYPYRENLRYTLQRWTGVVAFAFILWHVFHTRGWLPGEWWRNHVTLAWGGGTFDATNAAASMAASLQNSVAVLVAYGIGVLANVYHLSNGVWSAGITWGVWTSPRAQRWATVPCAMLGLALAVMGFGALAGFQTLSP